MANIVSSTRTAAAQIDGRWQVNEVHTDVLGLTHVVSYLADAMDDLDANMAAHAAQLGADLASAEIAGNVAQVTGAGAAAVFTFAYSTIADAVSAGLVDFSNATAPEALMLSDFLQAQSDANLEAWFGLTTDQIATIRVFPSMSSQMSALTALIVAVSL